MFFRSFAVLAATVAFNQSAVASLPNYLVGTVEVLSNTTINTFAPTLKETHLSDLNLDPMAFPGVKAHSGFVKIDRAQKVITLIIQQAMGRCPQNQMCIQMMPAPLVIELPLIAKQRDSCGTVTYTARLDQRPVDGILQELTVKDHTKNNCPTFAALPETEVDYATETSGSKNNILRTHSTFSGGVLR